MKHFAISLLFLLAGMSAWAEGAIVKGQVVDSETGLGEPYATFKIWKEDKVGIPVILTITDEDGNFEATLSDKGTYSLEISALGRKPIHGSFAVVDLSESFCSIRLWRFRS